MTSQRGRLDPYVEPLWVRLVHAGLDGVVLAFALWTVLYEVAMGLRLSAWTAGQVWVPLAVLVVGGCGARELLRARRGAGDEVPVEPADLEPAADGIGRRVLRRAAFWVGAGCTLAVAVLAWWGPRKAFGLLWLLGLVAAAVLGGLAATRRTASGRARPAGSASHLAAAAVVLGLTALTMFVRNPTLDDIYYVNRSVWVAQHGTFALGDTIFSPDVYPSTYGLPVASIEGLLGSLAHLAGLGGATFVYLYAAPALVVLAGWSAWRLVSVWAPRRALLVFLGAVLVCLFTATGRVGDFSYARIWQGKVLAICVVVPLVWLHLTKLAEATRTSDKVWSLGMLLGLGVAFAGLTTSSVIMAPVMATACVLAALVLGRTRWWLVAAAALFTLPALAEGIAVLLLSPSVSQSPQPTTGPASSFVLDLGKHDPWPMALLAVGLLLGPSLARSRESRALAAAATLAVFVVMSPGLIRLLDAVTGAGPIAYRLLLVAPFPVLTGLLLSAPAPARLPRPVRGVLVAAAAAGLAAVMLVGGTPLWGRAVAASLTSQPTWKVHLAPLADAEAVLALHPGPGLILMPPAQMESLPLVTTRVFAVAPRRFYLHGLPQTHDVAVTRHLLMRLMKPSGLPVAQHVDSALATLHVSLACDYPDRSKALALLRGAGYHSPVRAGRLTCLRSPAASG